MPGFWQLKVGRHQFSRPPIRSCHFWVETLFLLVVALMAVFLTLFFRAGLSGQLIFNMSMPLVILTILWFGVLRVHQVVHEAYRDKWDSQDDDFRAGILLDKLSFLSYARFNYAATAVMLAYGGLLTIATAHR